MFLSKEHELAYQLMEKQKYTQALIEYSRLIQSTPNNAMLHSERAVIYLHLGNKTESLKDFDKAVEIQPDYAYRYASRGHAKDYMGDIEGAISDYEKAVELDPMDDISYNNLGLLMEKKGNMDKAQKYFERSNKLREAEDQLHQLIDELEGSDQTQNVQSIPSSEVKNTADSETNSPSKSTEIKKIFTDSNQRKEFWSFIKGGFKFKNKK